MYMYKLEKKQYESWQAYNIVQENPKLCGQNFKFGLRFQKSQIRLSFGVLFLEIFNSRNTLLVLHEIHVALYHSH